MHNEVQDLCPVMCTTIIPFNTKIKGFSDLNGAFPQKSIRGNLYDMVLYDCNINSILDKPIKNRRVATICEAFLNIHNMIKSIGSNPKFYIMDNDCSSDLTEAIKIHSSLSTGSIAHAQTKFSVTVHYNLQ